MFHDHPKCPKLLKRADLAGQSLSLSRTKVENSDQWDWCKQASFFYSRKAGTGVTSAIEIGKQKRTRIYRDQGSLDRGWNFRLDAAEFRSRPTLPFLCHTHTGTLSFSLSGSYTSIYLSVSPFLSTLPYSFVILFLFSSFIPSFFVIFHALFTTLAVIAVPIHSDCPPPSIFHPCVS